MASVLACIPLIVAALALLVWRRSSRDTSLLTFLVTLLVVLCFSPFHLSLSGIVLSVGKGGATALTIAAILVPALLFYQAQRATGAIPVLQRGIALFVPDREEQILLLVFGVGPSIEAMCGFGVGAIVIIPLLSALEADKLRVASLSLFSQIVSPWGALGVGSALAATMSGVHLNLLSIQTALLLAPVSLCFALLTLLLAGGKEALERYWPLALGSASLQMGGILLGNQLFGSALAGVTASLLIVAFFLLQSRNRWGEIWQAFVANHHQDREISSLFRALVPYLLLLTSLVVTRLIPAVSDRLQTRGVLTVEALDLHFAVLYSPGICLLLAAITPFALFSLPAGQFSVALAQTRRQSIPSLMAILGFLATAALMQGSGMAAALGSAVARIGQDYMWMTALVGGTSGWLTGSVLSGNALSVPMQMQASAHANLPLPWIMAVQNTSTALAAIVSPTRLILILTASGALGHEGALLRKVGPIVIWSLALVTVLLVWFLSHALLSLALLLFLVNAPLVLLMQRFRGQKQERASIEQNDEPLLYLGDPLP